MLSDMDSNPRPALSALVDILAAADGAAHGDADMAPHAAALAPFVASSPDLAPLVAALTAGDRALARGELDVLAAGELRIVKADAIAIPASRGSALRRLADGWPGAEAARHLRTAAKLLDDGLPAVSVAAGLRVHLDILEAPDDIAAIERLVMRAGDPRPAPAAQRSPVEQLFVDVSLVALDARRAWLRTDYDAAGVDQARAFAAHTHRIAEAIFEAASSLTAERNPAAYLDVEADSFDRQAETCDPHLVTASRELAAARHVAARLVRACLAGEQVDVLTAVRLTSASSAQPVVPSPVAERARLVARLDRLLDAIADDVELHLGRDDGDEWPAIACGKSSGEIDAWTDIREAFDANPNPCPACRDAIGGAS